MTPGFEGGPSLFPSPPTLLCHPSVLTTITLPSSSNPPQHQAKRKRAARSEINGLVQQLPGELPRESCDIVALSFHKEKAAFG